MIFQRKLLFILLFTPFIMQSSGKKYRIGQVNRDLPKIEKYITFLPEEKDGNASKEIYEKMIIADKKCIKDIEDILTIPLTLFACDQNFYKKSYKKINSINFQENLSNSSRFLLNQLYDYFINFNFYEKDFIEETFFQHEREQKELFLNVIKRLTNVIKEKLNK